MDLTDFFKKYELLNDTKNYIVSKSKAQTCRYCKKTVPEITFSERTHLLPELLGKNNLLTHDECDKCNKLFSDYESHLSTFFRPYITMLGIRGKKRIPKFQSRSVDGDEETRSVLEHIGPARKQFLIQNLNDYIVDPENKRFKIRFRKPPFIPIKVYKSLLKIGLSLMPQKLDSENQQTFEWLVNERDSVEYIPHVFITTLKRGYFQSPLAKLYRAKLLTTDDWEFPEHVLLLCFANQVVQIFMPFSMELKEIHDEKRKLSLDLFPGFIFDKTDTIKNIEIRQYDLSLQDTVTEDEYISFSYEDFE